MNGTQYKQHLLHFTYRKIHFVFILNEAAAVSFMIQRIYLDLKSCFYRACGQVCTAETNS